ncbi:SNF2 family N-terminal domain-containing protein [Saccharopolyspora kobensis]|uniref:SNF2 family N-terminal domain-containing protein n=1 Tax=Saccharopolyspora kobensis TaxID=146035 RepID=A0A1H5T097_9PSEU|nr:DEAD/DEAH box helicase [Saccharopolyspora kobensis]SEF56195.1 SNF2 family N-terminal domain-containing protein [Saccharopolyspora kobensis]SFC51888.1 SNF2 family N-terminal domain-containing protein [Saccharopolyspora kobensis]
MTSFTVGSLVSARGRDWVVLPESAEDMLVLRPLGGSDDELAAVFPSLEEVRHAEFARPSADDLGDALAAGLLRSSLRIGFRSGAGPFRSLAGIAVEPRAYQLVPLMMALRQRVVRMLISDDVGIGKTVEAGLIGSELLAQGSAQRLAVLCSPALAEQWQEELRTKFGIDAELVLASTVSKLERQLDLGQSLFDRHPYVVVSTDFIKSTRHRDDFVKHCPDMVIVDEAHSCVATDETASAQSQLRHELLERVAADPERHLLLVTATPHSGKESAFRALLGMVKPELADVDLDSESGRRLLAAHFVQRKRADVRQFLSTKDGLADDSLREDTAFPGDRFFKDETYKLSPAYRALLDDAVAYASERVTAAGEQGRREARIAWWSAIALLRSLVSSPRAAEQTLRTRAAAAQASSADEADRLGAPLTSDSSDSDALEGFDVAPGAETDQAGSRLAELAKRAKTLEGPTEDRKLAALVKHLKALLAEGYHPIVFCRYIPTAEYVAEHLEGKLGKRTVVRSVTGRLSPQQRVKRIEDLAAEAGEDTAARRVLVATDCLSEGVNLQHYFDAVVHYDLAWNPTRHDQREGRVDRYGQKRDIVRVVTLYGSDNGIDGKVLEVLIKKHRQIQKDLGISVSVPDSTSAAVTDAIVEWLLMRKTQPEQASLFEADTFKTKADELEADWKSAADREKTSRSKFAQRSIHPEEIAREVAAVRDTLGRATEVRGFTRHALNSLNAVLREDGEGGFTADLSGTPSGLRDALAPILGGEAIEPDSQVAFRSTAAVARGEVALVRTDPAVGALAGYVLNAALDESAPGPRPARRCGVIRTRGVETRTTLLLVRYRFHLALPSRATERQVVAEDARLLAFQGSPATATWLKPEDAVALLELSADENTDPGFAERTMKRVLDGLDATTPYLEQYGDELAAELLASHRRVRKESGEIVRGVTVTAQKPADILGAYVYLPVSGGAA